MVYTLVAKIAGVEQAASRGYKTEQSLQNEIPCDAIIVFFP
jgi:hypothetical protein